jgi:hypothetical protein
MTDDDQERLFEEFKALRGQYKIGTLKVVWMLLDDLEQTRDSEDTPDDDDTDGWISTLARDGLITSLMLYQESAILGGDMPEEEMPIPIRRARHVH